MADPFVKIALLAAPSICLFLEFRTNIMLKRSFEKLAEENVVMERYFERACPGEFAKFKEAVRNKERYSHRT